MSGWAVTSLWQVLKGYIRPFNIFVLHQDDSLSNKNIRKAHTEKIKLRHLYYQTPTVVFPYPFCITDVRIPPPWKSGGGHPFSMHPRYLIFVFARGKVFREVVIILILDALPLWLSNIFLVCSLANIIQCILVWSYCFLVVVGFRSTRMSACSCNQLVCKWLHRVLVYSKFVRTDV